jgi:excisionase family DNA binding protein
MHALDLPEREQQWISIGRAAELLGVNRATLRHWTAEGKVHAYRTPGGHRRFKASELAGLAEGSSPRGSSGLAALLVERLRHRYRNAVRSAATHEGWIAELATDARVEFHQLGEQLLFQLSRYVTSKSGRARRAALEEGRRLGLRYGHLAAAAGLGSSQIVDAYVLFRRPLLDVIRQVIAAESGERGPISRFMRDAEAFMDEVLSGIAAGGGSPTPDRLAARSA